jgi:hypothetical protein
MIERQTPDQVYQPADELEQIEPIGGLDELAHPYPQTPVPVVPVGLLRVRPTPPLARTDGAQTADSGTVIRVSGPTPQRRRLLISATNDVRLAGVQASLSATTGFFLPFGRVHEVFDPGEVYVLVLVNGTVVSWWHEMDLG